jgi:nitrous oxidase accessory protein
MGAMLVGRPVAPAVDPHDAGSTTAAVRSEGAADVALHAPIPNVHPPRPEPCRAVAPGVDLQTALDAASDGDTLCLAPGSYAGAITIARGITLWGPRDAVVKSDGRGTTVRVAGAGAVLLGLTISGSGSRYDKQDAGLLVASDRVRVEGVEVRDAVFGITVEQARGVEIRGNRIVGRPEPMLGLRGDALRLWEVHDSTVESNTVVDGRDVVVWYSSGNRIVDNVVTGSRYGTHFMYSHQNVVARNRYVRNVVGVFVMYSRQVALRDNVMAASGGAAGFGLGLKESSGLDVAGNVLVKNTVGMYIDSSPFQPEMPNRFTRNIVRLSETGVLFHSSPHENFFTGNSLRDNFQQVRVDGGGDALGVAWSGNDFDDYAGYDLDGDGVGDVPYELRSLTNRLTSTYPALAFLHGTPSLALLEAVSFILPLFQARTLLVDPAPRMAPLSLGSKR